MLNSRVVAFWWVHPFERSRLPRIVVTSVVLIVFVVLYGLPVSAQIQPPTASDSATLSAKADQARDADRLDDAVALYKQALALRPQWAEGWWSLGTIQYDRNAYREAAHAFEKVIALDPKAGTAMAMLGLCEFEVGDEANALRHIEEGKGLGIAKDPQLRNVMLYHEGVLLQRKGRFEGAQEALEELCYRRVQNDELTRALGMVQLRIRGKDSPSEGTPGAEIVTRLGRAGCLAAQKNFDAARKDYGNLVRKYPEYPNIHLAYGRFLLEAQDTTAALEEFEREIKNNPNNVIPRLEIAAVKYRVDSSGGLPYAEEAVKLDPQLPFGHYLLGLLYLDTKNFSAAISELEIAKPFYAKVPEVYFALGNAYARAGRKDEAGRARAIFTTLSAQNQKQSAATVYGEQPSGPAPQLLGPEAIPKPPP